jgi:hypothetical protein
MNNGLGNASPIISLEIGHNVVVEIQSRPKWNDTRLNVRKGERYLLSATGRWYDASFAAGPEGYKSPNFYFRALEGLRRVPCADWFALVVTVGQNLSSAFVVTPFAGAPPTTLDVTQDGSLFGFANDLSWFYFNNSGCVLLTIERLT